ncbi:MAG: DUF4861 family protein [Bacteroidota bacterium]
MKNIAIKLLVALVIVSCSSEKELPIITVENTLDVDRSFETIELTKEFLGVETLTNIGIRDSQTSQLEVTQTVDVDNDGLADKILFQPELKGNDKKAYQIVFITEAEQPKAEVLCYSRFVPERTDDYTWENNKVAFRVFGPTAQKMVEDSIPGGTLSSGVDAWLKRVDYPIINKWYKKELETEGTYHEDTGEGLDNFHVGISRGVGGIAIKSGSGYSFSKNYIDYRTITSGPIRTSFYLNYADWNVSGKLIKESILVSLDKGSNLSRFEISLEGSDKISAGLTLHEKDGKVNTNAESGWVSYWQPHADSELGTAILTDNNTFAGSEIYDVETKDLSNAYVHLKVKDNQVVYFAGFTWKESGQFNSKAEWENYLNLFSKKINNPLKVETIH